MKKSSFFLLSIAFLVFAGSAHSEQISEFPSCLSPKGEVIANYDNGTHGIPGVGSKIGSDAVHLQENGKAMQCFCGENGEGIQTNWLNTSNLTQDEIKVLQKEGWIFIPDGTAWGLSEGSYLAKNITYSCKSSSTTNSGGGDGRTDGRTDGRSDGLGSIVQSAQGTSLASTGNLLFIAETFGAGVLLTLTGILLRRKAN